VQNTAFGANSAPLFRKTSENTVDLIRRRCFLLYVSNASACPRNRDKHPCGRLLSECAVIVILFFRKSGLSADDSYRYAEHRI
jgi:hypothetical protein